MAGMVSVKDIMTKDVKVVRTDTSVKEVVEKMNKFDIGSVVVVQGNRPIGIITERDILKKIVQPCVDASLIKAREIMSSPVITIDENASIEEAAKVMTKKGIKKLPVTRENEVVGIITTMDLVRTQPKLVDMFENLLWTRQRESAT